MLWPHHWWLNICTSYAPYFGDFMWMLFNPLCICSCHVQWQLHWTLFQILWIFFFNVEFFTGKEFQKKRGICSFNALNHNNADKQLITSLLQKSVHHPSRANFVSIIVSRRGSWEHELSLVLEPLLNDHLKDGLTLVMLVTHSMNKIG